MALLLSPASLAASQSFLPPFSSADISSRSSSRCRRIRSRMGLAALPGYSHHLTHSSSSWTRQQFSGRRQFLRATSAAAAAAAATTTSAIRSHARSTHIAPESYLQRHESTAVAAMSVSVADATRGRLALLASLAAAMLQAADPLASLARADVMADVKFSRAETPSAAPLHQHGTKFDEGSTYGLLQEAPPLHTSLALEDERGSSYSAAAATSKAQNRADAFSSVRNLLADVAAEVVEPKGATCEEPYGVLPCSTSIGGNMFLIAAFGFILFQAAKLISSGSELLLEVMEPGLIGGLLLPLLGAFPDTVLITVSGLRGTAAEAQQEVMVGVGVLAGSSIMILSVAWAGSVFAGRCDLAGPNRTAVDRTLTDEFGLFTTGVTTDEQTRIGAIIMLVSTLPFFVVQVPLLDGHPTEGPEAAAIGATIALLGCFAFCAYQVAFPWLQEKKIEEARMAFVRAQALRGLSSFALPSPSSPSFLFSLAQEDDETSESRAREIFRRFDEDKDGQMSGRELRAMLIAIGADEERMVPEEQQIETWLKEFDVDGNGMVSELEFVGGLRRWVRLVGEEEQQRQAAAITAAATAATAALEGGQGQEGGVAGVAQPFWAAQYEKAKDVLQRIAEEGGSAEAAEGEGQGEEHSEAGLAPAQIYTKATVLMLSGAALAATFADPMIDSIGGFSTATSIPPFFVAFVVVPFASNASELISSIVFAQKRNKRTMSLTMSQVYGAITINNTLCLGIFLALVYFRGLTWDFSSEVTVVLATTAVVGALAASRTTFPLWMAGPVLALYPTAITGVALLDTLLGWH